MCAPGEKSNLEISPFFHMYAGSMVHLKGLLSLTAVAVFMLVMGAGVNGEKKLSHPALTRGTSLTMKVLYWYGTRSEVHEVVTLLNPNKLK